MWFLLERFPLPNLGAWEGYFILLWHSLSLPYNHLTAELEEKRIHALEMLAEAITYKDHVLSNFIDPIVQRSRSVLSLSPGYLGP